MKQTKLESLVEVCVNTLIGFLVSLVCWPIAAWYYDIPLTTSSHVGVVAFFTVVSILRGYIIRRFFNRGLHKLVVGVTKRIEGRT